MGNDAGIPFPFTTYGTSKGGLTVGRVYEDAESGKRFRFCQAHTVVIGGSATTITLYAPVCQVGAVTVGIATDDISEGLDASNPIPLGFATSACPKSTSTVTYYFWAQTYGFVHTVASGVFTTTLAGVPKDTDDDSWVIGDLGYMDEDATIGVIAVATTNAASGIDGPRVMCMAATASTDGATDTVGVFACMVY